MAAEPAPAPPAAPAAKRGNALTRKIGPMPVWAWVAIIAAALIGYAYWRNKQSAAASPDTTGTDASQVPQFVNQTYTTMTPPVAPVPGPVGPAGPPGTPGPAGPPGTPGSPPPPGRVKIGGHHVVTANGRETLAQIAKRYHTTPGAIIQFTESHKKHISPTEERFFKRGGKGRVPKGVLLWVPEPQVTG